MSEALGGRTAAQSITRYVIGFAALVVIAEVALFASGQSAAGAGVLVSPFLVGALALRLRRINPKRAPKSRPGGISIMAALIAMPALILIFVGIIIDDDIARFVCVAVSSTYLGLAGLIIAMSRTLPGA
jgi:hypothetical protein